ncbi:MAG: hypothetical protein Q4C42_10535 [Clostridia bacterium]|nr:hypothetical protein [Clostridia bacterium]
MANIVNFREQLFEKIRNDEKLNENIIIADNGNLYFSLNDEHIEYHIEANTVVRFGKDSSDMQEKKFPTEDSALHYFFVSCEAYLAHCENDGKEGSLSKLFTVILTVSFFMLLGAAVLMFIGFKWGFFLSLPMFVCVAVLMRKKDPKKQNNS